MTLEEKLAQLGGVWVTELIDEGGFDPAAARRTIGDGIGHVTRIGATTGLLPGESAALMNEIQRFAVEETRLGIPVLVHEEATGGYCARGATVFPQGIGLASTWDETLVAEVADAIRQQLVAVGARQALAPVLDVLLNIYHHVAADNGAAAALALRAGLDIELPSTTASAHLSASWCSTAPCPETSLGLVGRMCFTMLRARDRHPA